MSKSLLKSMRKCKIKISYGQSCKCNTSRENSIRKKKICELFVSFMLIPTIWIKKFDFFFAANCIIRRFFFIFCGKSVDVWFQFYVVGIWLQEVRIDQILIHVITQCLLFKKNTVVSVAALRKRFYMAFYFFLNNHLICRWLYRICLSGSKRSLCPHFIFV